MQDREIVGAIVRAQPDGIAAAFDRYAAALYDYCLMMLGDIDDACDAVQDTFVIAAAMLAELADPSWLRPWLYAVARNECLGRLRARASAAAGTGENTYLKDRAERGPAGPAVPRPDAPPDGPQRDGQRAVTAAALAKLTLLDRELVELNLRHGLAGEELAYALGVPPNQVNALVARARSRFQAALGVDPVLEAGPRSCPGVAGILSGWEGRTPFLVRLAVKRHARDCEACQTQGHPVRLLSLIIPPALPTGLAARTLHVVHSTSASAYSYRRKVLDRAGPLGPEGFPVPMNPPPAALNVRSHVLAGSGAAAFAVVVGGATMFSLHLLQHPVGSAIDAVISGPSRGPASQSPSAGNRRAHHGRTRAHPGAPLISPSAVPTGLFTPTPTPGRPSPRRSHRPARSPSPSPSTTPTISPSPTPTPTVTPTPTPTTPSPSPSSTATVFPNLGLFRSLSRGDVFRSH
jgi:RNA polymerase sigma factor (sigma-70 family)